MDIDGDGTNIGLGQAGGAAGGGIAPAWHHAATASGQRGGQGRFVAAVKPDGVGEGWRTDVMVAFAVFAVAGRTVVGKQRDPGFGKGGIIGGTMLGLGRALGETIAVYMIISPIFTINFEILKTGTNSVSSLIALRYGESSQFGLSALMAAGLVLFLITMAINFTASTIVARSRSGAES